MLELGFNAATPARRILCLGAHCDDIEIGMGATLMRLAKSNPEAQFRFVVLTGNETRDDETRHAFRQLLPPTTRYELTIERFRNGHFPYVATDVKARIEAEKDFEPELIFTHYRNDHHQDHRTVSELTANTFRNHLVFEYEILKYDGDLANPNVFAAITKEQLDYKIDALMQSFASQLDKQWFTPDVFEAMARIRGVHAASPTGFAEAFFARKLTVAF
ncbi:MAG: PIG-L deacetylase family protein [Pseudomonadota bacterium]